MTYYPEVLENYTGIENPHHYMAVVDESGQEIPITEMDIRRSLRTLEDEMNHDNQLNQAMDQLLEKVYAARAIA